MSRGTVAPMDKDNTRSPSNFRLRKRDNREMERKGFWIPADVAVELRIHCVRNRELDESEIVTQLLCDYLNKVQNRTGSKKLSP